MPAPDVRPLTPADLGERVIDALVPSHPGPEVTHVRPTWSEVWVEVRIVFGPVRSVFFIVMVVLLFPFQLMWYGIRRLIAKPVVKALLLAAVLGTGALRIWGWPGLLVVCLFVWLFTLFRQNQKSTAPRE